MLKCSMVGFLVVAFSAIRVTVGFRTHSLSQAPSNSDTSHGLNPDIDSGFVSEGDSDLDSDGEFGSSSSDPAARTPTYAHNTKLDVVKLLSSCLGDDKCRMKVSTETSKCTLTFSQDSKGPVWWKGPIAVLRNCTRSKRGKKNKQEKDGFPSSTCCGWGDRENGLTVQQWVSTRKCETSEGCIVNPDNISVLINPWNRVALTINFGNPEEKPCGSADGEGSITVEARQREGHVTVMLRATPGGELTGSVRTGTLLEVLTEDNQGNVHVRSIEDPSVEGWAKKTNLRERKAPCVGKTVVFRHASLEVSRTWKRRYWRTLKQEVDSVEKNLADLNKHVWWLIRRFQTVGDNFMEALTGILDPELANRPELSAVWLWARGTTLEPEAPLNFDARDPLAADFRNLTSQIPMGLFLDSCNAGHNCAISVRNPLFKCQMTVDSKASGTCFVTLSRCQDRERTKKMHALKAIEAFPLACMSKRGCCMASNDIEYDYMGRLGLQLKIKSIAAGSPAATLPSWGDSSMSFDESTIVSRSSSWGCQAARQRDCESTVKPLANLLQSDYKRESWRSTRKVGGTRTLQTVLGLRFPDVFKGKGIEYELCTNAGLARANKLRMALVFKTISGLVATGFNLINSALGMVVKILIRIAAGGFYAENSCIFEVSVTFPAYRDELFSSPKKFWSFDASEEMQKCMAGKNKLMRQIKSLKRGGSRVKGWMKKKEGSTQQKGPEADLGVRTMSESDYGRLKWLAGAAMFAAPIAGNNLGNSLGYTIGALPIAGTIVAIAEAIAGVYQTTALYNWARFQTLSACSVGLQASMHVETRNLIEKYQNLQTQIAESVGQGFNGEFSPAQESLTCAMGKALQSGNETKLAIVNRKNSETIGKVGELHAVTDIVDVTLLKLLRLAPVQRELIAKEHKSQYRKWSEKERKEFWAEILLNPLYFTIESLFPNDKYVDMAVQEEVAKEELEQSKSSAPQQDEFEREATLDDYCSPQLANVPFDRLVELVDGANRVTSKIVSNVSTHIIDAHEEATTFETALAKRFNLSTTEFVLNLKQEPVGELPHVLRHLPLEGQRDVEEEPDLTLRANASRASFTLLVGSVLALLFLDTSES